MALVKSKPTSAGSRFVVRVKTDGLYKGRPESSLIEKKIRSSGRNNQGRVTTRHKGGGHKKFYRIVDFKRDKIDITVALRGLNTIRTAPRTLRSLSTRMVSVVTSLRPRASW